MRLTQLEQVARWTAEGITPVSACFGDCPTLALFHYLSGTFRP